MNNAKISIIFFLFYFSSIGFSVKAEEVKKKSIPESKVDFYDYIDDDIRPLTFIWNPGLNFFWSASENCGKAKSVGFDSTNLLRLFFMYDYQIGNSHFFVSPGLGWSKMNFVFDKKFVLYRSLRDNSKVEIVDSSKLLKIRAEGDPNYNYSGDNIINSGLVTNYLEAAIEVQFRSDNVYYKEGFFGALGLKAGYLFSNPCSYIQFNDINEDRTRKEVRIIEPLGISSWKINLIIRFGYRIYGAFVDLCLTNIFTSDNKVNDKNSLKPLTVGFSVDLL